MYAYFCWPILLVYVWICINSLAISYLNILSVCPWVWVICGASRHRYMQCTAIVCVCVSVCPAHCTKYVYVASIVRYSTWCVSPSRMFTVCTHTNVRVIYAQFFPLSFSLFSYCCCCCMLAQTPVISFEFFSYFSFYYYYYIDIFRCFFFEAVTVAVCIELPVIILNGLSGEWACIGHTRICIWWALFLWLTVALHHIKSNK